MRSMYRLPVSLRSIPALFVLLATGAACRAQTPLPAAAFRPNIIFLLTDDQRANALGISGHSVLETPHIDRLARDGVLFIEAVRTQDWQYARYFRSDTSQYTAKDVDFEGRTPDFEHFFDLVNDPSEERNLIEGASQAARIAASRERSKQYSAELVRVGKDMKRYTR